MYILLYGLHPYIPCKIIHSSDWLSDPISRLPSSLYRDGIDASGFWSWLPEYLCRLLSQSEE